ncbi:hypothetical protein EV191_102343 [Tamaricihabitans halophyticus]|uniref:Hydantoinase/oxoprolinase-like protein n=1 Tax=Tamaricihabitans halophyticus TaxID=1262583 RepID=A0A4R2R6B7_9PSEU|nr:hypothetical protein [Tamaricihabitans halophyticus]TCP55131.1 hypothetical protein EV191_102343 [Tamaricihabitans halophyticus]
MDHRWPAGSRIGVGMHRDSVTAALVAEGSQLGRNDLPLDSTWQELEGRLAIQLRQLGSRARTPVESVAWELSDLLTPLAEASPVAALRMLPRAPVSDALAGQPSPLLHTLVGHRANVRGGHDLFGFELAPPDVTGAVAVARAAAEAGYPALAITASGAMGCPEHEQLAAEAILDAVPGLRLCLSHEVGGLGVLQREAAAVLTLALQPRIGELIGACERATASGAPAATAWFVAGDGGRLSAERLRTFPASALGSGGAAALLGAAVLAEQPDASVVLADGDSYGLGYVRSGLPYASSDVMEVDRMRLAIPQAVISPVAVPDVGQAGVLADGTGPALVVGLRSDDIAAARSFSERSTSETRLVCDADVVAVGSAVTEPSAWLDLVVTADNPEELERVRGTLADRACTLLASSGARPGTERIVSSTVSPLSFLRSGSYRVVLRASGSIGGAP